MKRDYVLRRKDGTKLPDCKIKPHKNRNLPIDDLSIFISDSLSSNANFLLITIALKKKRLKQLLNSLGNKNKI
jgi:ethanolamine ammonia-lyase small subunit